MTLSETTSFLCQFLCESMIISSGGFLFLYQLPGLILLLLLSTSSSRLLLLLRTSPLRRSRGCSIFGILLSCVSAAEEDRVETITCVWQTYISINSAVAPDQESVLYCHPDGSARFLHSVSAALCRTICYAIMTAHEEEEEKGREMHATRIRNTPK